MMNKIKGIKYDDATGEIDYNTVEPYSVPLTPREPKKPFLQKAKEAVGKYYGTMYKPLKMLNPSSCKGEFNADGYCQLDKLGKDFSLDKPVYADDSGVLNIKGANMKGITTDPFAGEAGREYVRATSFRFDDPRNDTVYMNPSFADEDSKYGSITALHELGHNLFGKKHPGGDIFTEPYYQQANDPNRYDDKGCIKDIMDTYNQEHSVSNKCYEENKDVYKEQFRQWVKEYLDIDENKKKCAKARKDY